MIKNVKSETEEVEEVREDRRMFLYIADMMEKLAAENFSTAITVVERMEPIIKSMDGMDKEAKALKMVAEGGRVLLSLPHCAQLRSSEERGTSKKIPSLNLNDPIVQAAAERQGMTVSEFVEFSVLTTMDLMFLCPGQIGAKGEPMKKLHSSI